MTDSNGNIKGGMRAFYPLMVVCGIIQILAPSSISIIMRQLGLRESLGGLLQMVYFSGLLLGTLLLTRFMQRLSVKRIMLAQAMLLIVSLLLAAAAPWYVLLLLFFFFSGFANGSLLTLPAIYVTAVYGSESPRIQNILYGFLSLGFVVGPVIAGLIARMEWSWRWCLAIPALLAIPMALPLALAGLQRVPQPKRLSVAVIREVLAFNRSLFLGLVLSFLLYAAAQASVNTWLVSFLEIERGMISGTAHLVLMGTAACLTVGRWACGYLSRFIDPFDILVAISLASGVLVFLAPLPDSRAASILLYMLLGLAYSGIYPFLVSYAVRFPDGESSAVITAIISAGAVGGVVFPYLIGLLNQHINPILGMSSVSVFIVGVIVCVHWIKPHVIDTSTTVRQRMQRGKEVIQHA
ncbi:MAG: MFS transporter [Actinobacteria bacterium]|jgi:fucose permease|nr:MAG: MFS transporter [Actinomycetota bacterium]